MSNPIVGQTVILQATFTNIAGDNVDPSSVDLTVEDPDGNVTTPATTNPSVGVYQHQLDLTTAGDWDYRFEGTTAEGTAVCEGRVCAIASGIPATSP